MKLLARASSTFGASHSNLSSSAGGVESSRHVRGYFTQLYCGKSCGWTRISRVRGRGRFNETRSKIIQRMHSLFAMCARTLTIHKSGSLNGEPRAFTWFRCKCRRNPCAFRLSSVLLSPAQMITELARDMETVMIMGWRNVARSWHDAATPTTAWWGAATQSWWLPFLLSIFFDPVGSHGHADCGEGNERTPHSTGSVCTVPNDAQKLAGSAELVAASAHKILPAGHLRNKR